MIIQNILASVLVFSLMLQTGCSSKKNDQPATETGSITVKDTAVEKPAADTLTDDTIEQSMIPSLQERLKPVKENFSNTIAITKWDSIVPVILEAPGEGAEATYFYKDGLRKIIHTQYGETFKAVTEYYLKGAELSFVFVKEFRYNRPINYDAKAAKASGDTEVFDPAKSTIYEYRNYFEDGKLIFISVEPDNGSPNAGTHITEERKRLLKEFEQLRAAGK